MTNKRFVKFDLKRIIELINAWRNRVLTISVTKNISNKVEMINKFGHDMMEVAEVLCNCSEEDFSENN